MMNAEGLPPELLSEIFSRLGFEDIVSAGRVCRRWEEAASDPTVWSAAVVTCNSKRGFAAELAERSELIRNLEIKGIESGGRIGAILAECRRLRSLALIVCRVDAQTMRLVNRLSGLTALSLKNCYRVMGSSVDADWDLDFKSLPNLKTLQLSDFGLADRNFEGLLACERLTVADIKKIKLSQSNALRFVSQNGKILESLHLRGGENYNDECAVAISKCDRIRSLYILRCNNFTDAGLAALKRIKLTSLVLWNNVLFSENGLVETFSDEGFSERLKYLSFSKTENLTKKVIATIAEKCSHLEFLGIYRCPKLMADRVTERNIKELFKNTDVFYD